MVNIIITKTTTNSVWGSGTHTWTLTLKNFLLFRVLLTSPASIYTLPENEANDAIVLKILGNEMRVEVNWKIVPQSTNVATGDITHPTQSVMDQVGFLTNEFQPTSIVDLYTITIESSGFSKTMLLESLEVSSSDAETPTWTARLKAVVGDVVASVNVDAPEPPINLSADTGTADEVTLTWSDPGSDPTPSAYTVERRAETEDWKELPNGSGVSSPYTDDNLVTGTRYRYRIRSENNDGDKGLPSAVVEAVVT